MAILFAVSDDVKTKALGNLSFISPLLVSGFNIYNNIYGVGELHDTIIS